MSALQATSDGVIMDSFDKIKTLGESARYDVCLTSCIDKGRKRDTEDPLHRWIYPAALPNGGILPILKILMSNACENNCLYCVNRKDNDFERVSFEPEELAKSFMDLFYKRMVFGLFLSSGILCNVNETMEKMIKTVAILRRKYFYKGYVHLKILPGVHVSYIEQALQLAERVSINLEAPTQKYLNKIAPQKNFEDDLIKPLKQIGELLKKGNVRARAQTTQFLVGVNDETDNDLLRATTDLYKNINLWRAYFSAFQPVKNTPLENHMGVPLTREHRLYQADYLLRQYGFGFEELIFEKDKNLSLDLDPKLNWALKSENKFPMEINKASYEELLRIPGIGPVSAKKIFQARKKHRFILSEELKPTGAVLKRAEPFILINGKKSADTKKYNQLSLI